MGYFRALAADHLRLWFLLPTVTLGSRGGVASHAIPFAIFAVVNAGWTISHFIGREPIHVMVTAYLVELFIYVMLPPHYGVRCAMIATVSCALSFTGLAPANVIIGWQILAIVAMAVRVTAKDLTD